MLNYISEDVVCEIEVTRNEYSKLCAKWEALAARKGLLLLVTPIEDKDGWVSVTMLYDRSI